MSTNELYYAENCIILRAPWSGTNTIGYIGKAINLDNIIKIEIDCNMLSNSVSVINEFRFGFQKQQTIDNSYDNGLMYETINTNLGVNEHGTRTTFEMDLSEYTGNYYLKFDCKHAGGTSAYTAGVDIHRITFYTKKY